MEIDFAVSKQCQSASGGSFVAKYRATIDLSPGVGVTQIAIINTHPSHPAAALLADVIEHIQTGVETVLRSRSLDGRMRVTNLVIHDVDCNPRYYERFTAEELEAAIALSGISG
jgi:hypothetical protein